jgi:hypothetical protein
MRTLLLLCLMLMAHLALTQYLYNPNDERFKSLYLEKMQNDFKLQQQDFERQKLLHDKGLISEQEFEQSKSKFLSARISYQQSILAIAFEQPHITIDRGTKYQSSDGKKKVKLILRNSTGGMIDGQAFDTRDFEGIRTDRIANVYVSLLNDQHAIISRPYEAKIAVMPYNTPVPVDFLLLQDLDYITVRCVYGDKSEEKKILVQKDESADQVLLTSEQFSQEVDLGAKASYDLTLELFSRMENVYKLVALNLPRQITYDFLEAQSNARLSQVKFSQDVNSRKLSLAVYVPDRCDSTSFTIDKPIEFFAAAVPREHMERIDVDRRNYTAAELAKLHVSVVRLELVPRGVGRIQVRAANFYHEIKVDETVRMSLTVYNDGTRRLDNIKISTEGPLNWTSTITPDLVGSLPPGKEEQIQLTIKPAGDVNVGDYEVTLKTESFADNRRVQSDDKKIRVHVSSNTSVLGTSLLVLLLVGLLAGIVVFGVRLSRR